MFVSGATNPNNLPKERGLIPVLPASADEQWSSHDTLSLPTYHGERERRHACGADASG
jgi:hypothetical protein